MPLATIAFGLILILAGLGTYVAADDRELVALLPAVLGFVALACGVGAMLKKHLRMHLIHAAVLVALVGVLFPLFRLWQFLTELGDEEGLKLIRIFVTTIVSGLYLYTAIQSFVSARRKRKVDTALGKTDTD